MVRCTGNAKDVRFYLSRVTVVNRPYLLPTYSQWWFGTWHRVRVRRPWLLANFNTLYTPGTNKNTIVFVISLDSSDYSSSAFYGPPPALFFRTTVAPPQIVRSDRLYLTVFSSTPPNALSSPSPSYPLPLLPLLSLLSSPSPFFPLPLPSVPALPFGLPRKYRGYDNQRKYAKYCRTAIA